MLVTLIVVLEHLDRAGLVTAETARVTQLSLDRYSLAMNKERTAAATYLLTRDPQALARYRAARDETRRDERQLVSLAALDQVDVAPTRTAAAGSQAWADSTVSATPAQARAVSLDAGDRLFSAFEAQERHLDGALDGAATQAATQADQRSAFLAAVSPAVGMLLLGLLLFLGGLVIRSMLRTEAPSTKPEITATCLSSFSTFAMSSPGRGRGNRTPLPRPA